MIWPDAVRFLIIAEGALLGAAIGTVMVLHWRAYNAVKCEGKGLLPLHVASISASYGMLVFGWTFLVVDNLGKESLNWFHYITAVAFAFGLYSLHIVAKTQRRRISIQTSTTTAVVQDTVKIED